ncbi:IclR family transcriptional regulator [Pseudonocardia nematodicida]|uniref:IclR family transcriptional regulator n=1 Tax=Pseudonocardia nematodicida TaxID=1206997 RepID=A0ABV1K4A4_9PSEU
MSSAVPRSFAVLDLLVGEIAGLPLGEIATRLDLPKSAAHRVLTELVQLGYLIQDRATGHYVLGLRLVSQALRHLASIPVVDLAKPLLDRIAHRSGELVRLGLQDGDDSLVWVAKAQGARSGLRFDPDDGREIKLARSSSGLAWLSTLPPGRAEALVRRQGFDDIDRYGPDGARDVAEAMEEVRRAREQGYAWTESTFELGGAVLAVPIGTAGRPAVGTLSIAGPQIRWTRERAQEILPDLRAASDELVALLEVGP